MAFPTTNLSLKAVCDAYGVASNMGALRGKIYYQSPNPDAKTIPSTGALSLDIFKESYINNPVVNSGGIYIMSPTIYYTPNPGNNPMAVFTCYFNYTTTFGVLSSITIVELRARAITDSGNDTFYNYIWGTYVFGPESSPDYTTFTPNMPVVSRYTSSQNSFTINIPSNYLGNNLSILCSFYNGQNFLASPETPNSHYNCNINFFLNSSGISISHITYSNLNTAFAFHL